MAKPNTARRGASKPSVRLAAIAGKAKPKAGQSTGPRSTTRRLKPAKKLAGNGAHINIDAVELTAPPTLESFDVAPAKMRVRTKFVVVDRQDVPAVIGGDLVMRHHVKLAAAYEAEPIHHGLGTIQGNRDNRVFGLGQPEAAIVMVFESKAVADVFGAGRGFLVDFSDV